MSNYTFLISVKQYRVLYSRHCSLLMREKERFARTGRVCNAIPSGVDPVQSLRYFGQRICSNRQAHTTTKILTAKSYGKTSVF